MAGHPFRWCERPCCREILARCSSRARRKSFQSRKLLGKVRSLRVRKAGLPPLLLLSFHWAMARKWSNQNLPEALHFVTGNILNRKPVFKKDFYCEAFTEPCANLLKDWPCKLIAWVLMPDHFHMVVNPRDGRVKEFLGALKSLTARSLIET